MPSKSSLRDKLDEDQLDLSLMQLTEVPVEEMKNLPRGTTVDLSNNFLTYLPDTFPSLTHIVKLDLSKNSLEQLPEYFGNLRNLKRLDLYSNKIERLPVSFSNMKNLKWLDLKNNPLVPALLAAAGPCITASDCAMCAKKVVALMQSAQSQLELERNRKHIEDTLAKEKRAKEEQEERERLRAEKRAAKERRRDEARARRESEVVVNSPQHEMEQPRPSTNGNTNGKVITSKYKAGKNRENQGRSCYSKLLVMLFGLIMLTFSMGASILWIYTGGQLDQHSIEQALPVIQHDFEAYATMAGAWSDEQLKRMGTSRGDLSKKSLELWAELKRRNDLVAYYLNENLGPYFCRMTTYVKQFKPHIASIGQTVEKWASLSFSYLSKGTSDLYLWIEKSVKAVLA